MSKTQDISVLVLLFIMIFMSVFRLSNVLENEISWDVLGYYLPLPATFVHDDPLLSKVDWLEKVNEERNLTGTLYMVSSNDEGDPMYFFFLGMSFFYLPFFLIGHCWALLTGIGADGFGISYQYSLVIGALFYAFIGLYYLRKILRAYFDPWITSAVLLTIVFSTNYVQHMTLKNLETVNVLFMLVCIIVWHTKKWHEEQQLKHMLIVCSSLALIGMVKPSEIVIALVPLLWGVQSKESLKAKWNLLVVYKRQLLISFIVCLFIVSPQIIYWLIKTGQPIYDSYKNPGVGLDLWSPHVIEALFSYRKGWLLYTPVMLLFLFGFFSLYKQNKPIFFAILIYFLTTFYIISSWSEWWYGAGYSNRPLITTYPLIGICFGYFLVHVSSKKYSIKGVILILTLVFTSFNLFQWWQLRNDILDPYRTTKEYYWATFLKTSVTEQDRELLSVYRDFGYVKSFDERDKYFQSFGFKENFDEANIEKDFGHTPLGYYEVRSDQDFALSRQYHFNDLTQKDHIWICMSFDARLKRKTGNEMPLAVITMDRKGGHYAYMSLNLEFNTVNDWQSFNMEFMTPEIRDRKDFVKTYFWNRYNQDFEVDNISIEIYERKDLTALN